MPTLVRQSRRRLPARKQHRFFRVYGFRPDKTFFVWGESWAVTESKAVSNVHHHSPESRQQRLRLDELDFTPVACSFGESPEVKFSQRVRDLSGKDSNHVSPTSCNPC